MPFFKKVFGSKDAARAAKAANAANESAAPPKPHWQESWTRKHVQPEEVQELIHVCTHEMKSRGVCNCLPNIMPPVPTANLRQLSTFLSYYYPSDPHPNPALRATSCATSSRPTTKGADSSQARDWPRNCVSQSHWYVALLQPEHRHDSADTNRPFAAF
jgi:hypothetical protein